MSYAVCSCCGERTHPFGQGGGAELASDLGADLLGQVPLDERLRECGDSGEPLVLSQPDSPAAVAITDIAETLADRLAPKVPAATRIKRPLTVL